MAPTRRRRNRFFPSARSYSTSCWRSPGGDLHGYDIMREVDGRERRTLTLHPGTLYVRSTAC